jgi:hypothetical protein
VTAVAITCPVCGKTSHHPEDVRQGYCGNCHAFTHGRRLEPRACPTCRQPMRLDSVFRIAHEEHDSPAMTMKLVDVLEGARRRGLEFDPDDLWALWLCDPCDFASCELVR